MARIGVVVIGRNEGDRLRRCLESLASAQVPIIYVDSGSTDLSVELATRLGASVVPLDLSIPFTAARARNAGFDHLMECAPDCDYVQFVDGDCEVVAGWLESAQAILDGDARVGVVCGRRRERYPEASIYNRICDIEWDTPIGSANACGGDALMRVAAIQQVSGYNPQVIAAEDDELCLRLRRAGWMVQRIDAEMTIHDAAMLRFGQWWKRATRCGYAYAQGAALHGAEPERHFVAQRGRVLLWGLLIPLILLTLAWPTQGWSLIGFVIYPLQAFRIAWRNRRRPVSKSTALAYGISCMLAKFPECQGVATYHWRQWGKRPERIIEYK